MEASFFVCNSETVSIISPTAPHILKVLEYSTQNLGFSFDIVILPSVFVPDGGHSAQLMTKLKGITGKCRKA